MKSFIIKVLGFIKQHKTAFIAGCAVVVALVVAFAVGGSLNSETVLSDNSAYGISTADEATTSVAYALGASERQSSQSEEFSTDKTTDTQNTDPTKSSDASSSAHNTTQPTTKQSFAAQSDNSESSKSGSVQSETKNSQARQTTSRTESSQSSEPEETEDTNSYCTISVSCATILNNMSDLKSNKQSLVPSDGWILLPTKVAFEDGESVFDVFNRYCKENGLHMESSSGSYNTEYIEGIANLYEKDCGMQSGWLYYVNGIRPNYGVSNYILKDGDTVEFKYTCKGYGADLG